MESGHPRSCAPVFAWDSCQPPLSRLDGFRRIPGSPSAEFGPVCRTTGLGLASATEHVAQIARRGSAFTLAMQDLRIPDARDLPPAWSSAALFGGLVAACQRTNSTG